MTTSDAKSGETAFIQRYFAPLAKDLPGAFGLTDDAAALDVGDGFDVITSVDAVAADVHFFADDAPADIAWKALAVNVSDLVAKGAEPVAYLLSLAFPSTPSHEWMTGFCSGLGAAQSVFKIKLAGGDTDIRPGPLTVTITALGRVPRGRMVRRSGGRAGDALFLSGTLGDAGVGLALRQNSTQDGASDLDAVSCDFLLNRYHRPKPRTRLAPLLQTYANAAIDISDGLVKDTMSLARVGACGARVICANLPISDPARHAIVAGLANPEDLLVAGGDYEVLAALAPEQCLDFARAAEEAGVVITQIGELTKTTDVLFEGPDGRPLSFDKTGYDHFTYS